MKPGSLVRLRAYGGEIVRRVVTVEERGVIICLDEEWQAAKREGRDPVAVRFKLADVLGELPESPRSQRGKASA